MAGNRIERQVLRRAGGMQASLDLKVPSVPENMVRHEEVWNRDVVFLTPADNRIRYHKFKGDLFIKSYRKVGRQSRVRWSKPIDLEAGIRQADHIREAYDPKTGAEIEKTRQVITLVRSLSLRMQQSNLTQMDMQLAAQEAAQALIQAGFAGAHREERLEITEKIMKAASLDKRDRVNPSRSRMIMAHAWVDLIRELLMGKMTENKYGSIQAKLIRERELERFVLSQAASYIDELLKSQTSFEDGRVAVEFKRFIRDFLSREVVKLKPYSNAAATTRFLIMNTGTQAELDALRQYIGDEADMYKGTPPLTKLEHPEFQRRLTGVQVSINKVLEVGEINLQTKTSDRVKS